MTSLNLQGCEEVEDEGLSVLSMRRLAAVHNLAFTSIGDDGLMTLLEVSRAEETG